MPIATVTDLGRVLGPNEPRTPTDDCRCAEPSCGTCRHDHRGFRHPWHPRKPPATAPATDCSPSCATAGCPGGTGKAAWWRRLFRR
ncbi:hypothetical protein [Streptomyces filamentosus]|uniref:hypothetical protein n=1 Tax=Streptomyces filamentosus TaxID=67294 RepID=UPI0033EE54B3